MLNRDFDKQLRKKISDDFEGDKERELISSYDQTQTKLQHQVYPNIQGSEPNLTDHGIKHVLNVQKNTIDLLSDDGIKKLSGIEMYCLGMLILFHDVGNIYGRDDHQDKVAEVFDSIRGNDISLRREKTMVVSATRAHTGTARDGSRDTLKDIDNEREHLEGQRVQLRELAAILRLADELAEGPQRTSEFMQKEGLYKSESQQFHDYANITHTFIQRSNNRIVLTYEIDIDVNKPDKLRNFLSFIFQRIQKLDQERQYTRYYSELLAPFKFTEVTFNFHYGSKTLDIGLSPLKLTDIVVPGDPAKDLTDIDPDYSIDKLVANLLTQCQKRKKDEARQ